MPKTDRNDPIDRMLPNDPTDPIENAELTDPIDINELVEKALKTDRLER
jgi:hypothetical protein